jgi:rhodanese-related sulfurtransferase
VFERGPGTAQISVVELAALLDEDPTTPVIDVREPQEFHTGHVPGADLMPLMTVPLRHAELPKDRTVYVICHSGGRSMQACAWLAHQGYDVANVLGGTGEWAVRGLPIA